MSSSYVRACPLSVVPLPAVEIDPDLTARYLEDAAHYHGGYTPGVVRPSSLPELAACLRSFERVLIVGAQSSLTGGATPVGDLIVSTERLGGLEISADLVVAGAGVTLQAIQDELSRRNEWLPPVPTFLGATVGGAVATCAAGAATFKYGTIRPWVRSLTVILAGGDVLELHRGQCLASSEGTFEIETSTGVRQVRLPPIHMPDVPKRSAGYFSEPGMDLIDLFIGSEGTLGAIAGVGFWAEPKPAAICRWLVPVATETAAIALVDVLRRESRRTWESRDPIGIDIAAIEHVDARSIALVREDGIDRRLHLTLPIAADVALLVELELSAEAASHDLWSEVAAALDAGALDSPIVRFCRVLSRHGALDAAEVALPTDAARSAAFAEFREAVPAAVNRRVGLAARQIDSRISKTAADMIVPFDRFGEMMRVCRRLFAERELDLAVWGHISDGNVHPNLVPRRFEDVVYAREALFELGQAVIAMGGCPLAEHGVGRHPTKQALLQLLYGEHGVNAMRSVKRALDPEGRLAQGVIFSRTS